MVQPLGKIVWILLTKLYIFLLYDSAITDVSSSITAKTWKQPSYPLASELINKMWYFRAMEYYSALEGNELSSHEKDTEGS